jgi:hypothetical protein
MIEATRGKVTRRREAREVVLLLSLPREAPITLAEAARIAACSLRHLMAERALGRGPKVYSLGAKTIRSTVGDALAWATARPEVAR